MRLINKRLFRKMGKKIVIFTCIISVVFTLTGCRIFKEKVPENEIYFKSDQDLEEDIYYVKDGTRFASVHMGGTSKTTSLNRLDSSRILWFGEDRNLIPTCYKGEQICYKSEKVANLVDVSMERFRDIGYTIGIKDAYFEDGFICLNPGRGLIANTDAAEKMKTEAKIIRIESIDGITVTESMLTPAGTLLGFEDGKEYEIAYYKGTVYGKSIVKADLWAFQQYEINYINESDTTPNGYISIHIPDDYKSGYYVVNNSGLFRYYDKNKTEVDGLEKMDEPYFSTEEEQLLIYSQQYNFTLDTNKKNMLVDVQYSPLSLDEGEEIKAILKGPDGTTYEMLPKKNAENCVSVKIAMAIGGRWIVNVIPKDLSIKDVNVSSESDVQEKAEEKYTFHFAEDMSNITFRANFKGEGVVTGILVDESGFTYEFVLENDKNKFITCNMAYLKKGDYEVSIFHNTDTSITGVEYIQSNEDTSKTIIIED